MTTANAEAETRREQDSAHATDCSEPLSPAFCSPPVGGEPRS